MYYLYYTTTLSYLCLPLLLYMQYNSIYFYNIQTHRLFYSFPLLFAGMKELPYQLARPVGSLFEPIQPPGSVYLGYSPDTMGVLLVPTVKNAPVTVGTQLRALTIVYDDKIDLQEFLSSAPIVAARKEGKNVLLETPDGYPVCLSPYSEYFH